jgi:hypothetical protein
MVEDALISAAGLEVARIMEYCAEKNSLQILLQLGSIQAATLHSAL